MALLKKSLGRKLYSTIGQSQTRVSFCLSCFPCSYSNRLENVQSHCTHSGGSGQESQNMSTSSRIHVLGFKDQAEDDISRGIEEPRTTIADEDEEGDKQEVIEESLPAPSYPPTAEDWRRYRTTFTKLYWSEDKTLTEAMTDMQRRYNFRAT